MKVKNKIKNRILISLLKLIRLFQKKPEPFDEAQPRLLLVTTTALGDTLWATPVIEDIRKKYKNGYVACLCSFQAKALLEKNRNIDKIFLIKQPFCMGFIPLLKLLKKEKFQAVAILHSSQRLIVPLCYLLNTSIFSATEGLNKGLDQLLTHPTPKKAVHEIDRRFEVVQCLNVDKTTDKMTFYFDEDPNFLASETIEKMKRPFIVFHPGAKDFFRAWDKSAYGLLGKMLQESFDCTISITGSKEEEEIVSHIAKKIPKSIAYIGNLDLSKLATLYKHADLVITGDTGPLHLALAVETKTIALFVPTDPRRFGPLNTKNSAVIKKPQTCSPCKGRKCKDPKCFLQITPKEVFDLCKVVLK